MVELVQDNWILFVIALVVGLLVAWWIFVASRRTKVEIERRDDQTTAPKGPRRNQALIDAPPAAASGKPPGIGAGIPPVTPLGMAGAGEAIAAAAAPLPRTPDSGTDSGTNKASLKTAHSATAAPRPTQRNRVPPPAPPQETQRPASEPASTARTAPTAPQPSAKPPRSVPDRAPAAAPQDQAQEPATPARVPPLEPTLPFATTGIDQPDRPAQPDSAHDTPPATPSTGRAATSPEPSSDPTARSAPEPAAVAPAPAPAAAEPSPAPPPAQPAARQDGADELLRIKGLGPKLAQQLQALGVTSLAQVAAWDDAEIDRIDAQLGRFQGRIRRDDWPEQARLLTSGDTVAYEQRFGRL